MSCNNLFEEDEKEDLDQKAKEEENELVEVALKDKKTAKKKRKQMLEKIKVIFKYGGIFYCIYI